RSTLLWHLIAKSTDEPMQLPVVGLGLRVVMVPAGNGDKAFGFLRRPEEFLSEGIRNGAVGIAVALQQRSLVAGDLCHRVEFSRGDHPRHAWKVLRGHL